MAEQDRRGGLHLLEVLLRAQALPFDRDQGLGDRAAERIAGAEQDDPVGRIFAHRDLDGAGEIIGFEDLGGEGVVAAAPRALLAKGRQIWPRPSTIGTSGAANQAAGSRASARSDEPCISGLWKGP